VSKSAASRRFVALSAARMQEWMASDLSKLDLLVIQIDSIHMDEDLILVAAIGVDAKGDKHPLGLTEGATENAATVQALIDNLVERGLDPAVPRLFIIDGAKALSKAIRRTFGRTAAIQRCQVHKARNIISDCPHKSPRPGEGLGSCGLGGASRRTVSGDVVRRICVRYAGRGLGARGGCSAVERCDGNYKIDRRNNVLRREPYGGGDTLL
jgi:hypothetical protein